MMLELKCVLVELMLIVVKEVVIKRSIYEEDDKYFHWAFNMLDTYDDAQRQTKEREERRTNIAIIVLDYLSRLENTYLHREIN